MYSTPVLMLTIMSRFWSGLKYKKLNTSRMDHDFSIKKLNCASKTTFSENIIF